MILISNLSNISRTFFASFLRNKPWSTNTQVNRSPIALCNNNATVDESTPPLNAHKTESFPTWAFILSIVLSTNESIVQRPLHPHIS